MTLPATPPSDSAPLLEWALWYASQGWPVFPCYGKKPIGLTSAAPHGFYNATCAEATIQHWWAQWPEANIGMPVRDGEVVTDIDPRNGGDTTLHELQLQYGPLPDTLTSHTGGGGEHRLFTSTVPVKNKAEKTAPIGPGINIQAIGSYIILPPSIHPDTGRRYVWDVVYGPDSMTPQPAPAWLEELIRQQDTRDGPDAIRRDPLAPILEGTREATLMSLAGAMRRVNAAPDDIRAALESANQRCVPPLEPKDLDRLTRSVGRYAPAPVLTVAPPAAPWSQPLGRGPGQAGAGPVAAAGIHTTADIPTTVPLADYFNARELVERHGADMRYCKAWHDWLVWTGTHWRRDDLGQVMQWAKGTVMAMLDRLKDLPDAKTRDAFYRHIRASLSTARLEAMVKSANNEPGIRVLPDEFNQQPWLLNCVNGTLDLQTGDLQPHRRDDFLLKCLPIPYEPHATCPLWDRFLWRVMGGSVTRDDPDASGAQAELRYEADRRAKDLIDFLQRAVGYSLTGLTSEHCLFILHGSGRNGKSTFVETIQAMCGPYGKTADMSTFLARKDESVRNDLADLYGARFVAASEADKGKRLAEGLVKRLTGGDLMKARFLFQEYFEFLPQMHVWLAVNTLPVIRGVDDAIWERIRTIPFTTFLRPEERDKHLGAKLRAELPGILAWAVRGCLEWYRYDSLKPPPDVLASTAAYRKEMDTFGQFLDECCLLSPDVRVQAGVLYKAYHHWCLDQGHYPESLTEIGKLIEARDDVTKKKSSVYWYHGIGLYSPQDEE